MFSSFKDRLMIFHCMNKSKPIELLYARVLIVLIRYNKLKIHEKFDRTTNIILY